VNYKYAAPKLEAPQPRQSAPRPAAAPRAARVLIADDELSMRMLLTRMLKAWGFGVQHVGSAIEALGVMTAEPADILLCDVGMPEHDGLWLAEHVHAGWPATAIIMVTGRQDSHSIQTSRKLGAVAYVTKPFSQYLLREALERASHRP
jgi:CheY-like chemotaxis protein